MVPAEWCSRILSWSRLLDGAPALQEVRLELLKDLAELLDAVLRFPSGEPLRFHHERRGPTQIERSHRLEQVLAIEDRPLKRQGAVIDGSGPDLVWNMEIMGRHVSRSRESLEGFRGQHALPDGAQIHEALPKARNHVVLIHVNALDAHLILKSEHRHRLGVLKLVPCFLLSFHVVHDAS